MARITGRDPKYGLAREFVRRRDVTTRRTNVYRTMEWAIDLEEGAIYEYRFAVSSRQEERGFWRVLGGQLVEIDYDDVLEAIA
ncbi:hypothetical protein [Thermaerobacter litoralis]